MEHPVTAIYDANVLYPAPLRDFFIRLAHAGLVRARWTDAIHDEWVRHVLADDPSRSPERLARTRSLMNEAVRDCLVTGYEDLIESLSLPDPDDRHVLAAAIRADAEVIVTFNLNDFPASVLANYHIAAEHPDDFLLALFDAAPGLVCAAVKRQREGLRNPPRNAVELLATFERQGLVQIVGRLRQFVDVLKVTHPRACLMGLWCFLCPFTISVGRTLDVPTMMVKGQQVAYPLLLIRRPRPPGQVMTSTSWLE